MPLCRSYKSVQNLTLLEYYEIIRDTNGCGIRSVVEDDHAYSEGRHRSPEEYENNRPNSILDGKVSSTSKFAKKKGMYGCGIRSEVENNHAYSEGRHRSPEEYDVSTVNR